MKTRKKPKTFAAKLVTAVLTARRRATLVDLTIERAYPEIFVSRLNLEEGC
jgi:hypothetical protein